MSQKSSVPQAVSFVSQVLKRDTRLISTSYVTLKVMSGGCGRW